MKPVCRCGMAMAMLVGACLIGAPVAAQTGTVRGIVVVERSGEPLGGAVVRAIGGPQAVTGVDGRFVLGGLSGVEVRLRVEHLGYSSAEQVVRVGASGVRIPLTESAVELNEIVVTGTAGGQARRAVGNSIAKVDATDAVDRGTVSSVTELLNGRAPGVVVQPATGLVGSGPRIRIRGASSLSLDDQPLVYVDGVRVNNETNTGLAVQGLGGVISRLNDIDPADIESIEVIKGPAAATLYGTEASNGVVQIITKKGGVRDEPRLTVRVRQGANWFADPAGRIDPNYMRHPATGEILVQNLVEQEEARGTPIFGTGHLQGYHVGMDGGSEQFRYRVSAGFDKDNGIEPTNYLERFTGRSNLTFTSGDALEVNASLGLVKSETGLAFESSGGGVFFSTIFGLPILRDTPRRGFLTRPPEATWPVQQPRQLVSRFMTSLNVRHSPTSWFTQRLVVGADITSQQDELTIERIVDPELLQFWPPSTAQGSKTESIRTVDVLTFDYNGTFTAQPTARLQSNTTVGAQVFRTQSDGVSAQGTGFPVPGLTSLDALAVTFGGDEFLENATVGVFVQQQFALEDRLFLTGAIRADDNSAFGEDFDLVYYPKVSASWVVSEEPFWRGGWFETLRVRGAYGQSGQQPEAFAALRSYQAVTGGNGEPTITPEAVGNPDLAPERGEELEVGFEAGMLDGRLGLDFTFYHQRVTDAIVLTPSAPSEGFPGSQFVNVGEVRNRGVELQLQMVPLETGPARLDLGFSFSLNDNEVRDVGDRDFIGVGLGVQRHQVGHPVGAWFTRKVVSADLGEDGVARNVLCDGGPGAEPVPCAQAPAVFIGRPTPRYEGTISAELTLFGRLRLSALVDAKAGHKVWDNNIRARCVFIGVCEENVFPERFDPIRIAEIQNGVTAFAVSDADFAKLRELSGTLRLPGSWAEFLGASGGSVSVAARNLHTWTDYTGLDPEAYVSGVQHLRLEQGTTPQLTSIVTTVTLNF